MGLVITVYDIQDISGGFIYPSDGAAVFDVTFRLAVFLPFDGEVIVGRLAKSTRCGRTALQGRCQAATAGCRTSTRCCPVALITTVNV